MTGKRLRASSKPKPPALTLVVPSYPCGFCKRVFTSDKTALVHLCEPKRRALQRGERPVTLGFQAYGRFWRQRMNPRHTPTWGEFEKSGLYLAFVRFGRHILNNNAINPLGFIDFLLRGEVGIDDWCKEAYYQTYVRELNKTEGPLDALARNILLMETWAIQHGSHWTEFFRQVAPSQAVLWIQHGRISPWVLFTASSAGALIARLSAEQVALVSSVIDEGFWSAKMQRHKSEMQIIIDELTANNV